MQKHHHNEIQWLTFDLLSEANIAHGIFLRHGGYSEHPFSSLNVSDDVGDHSPSVQKNRRVICDILEMPNLTFTKQCHGDALFEVLSHQKVPLQNADILATRVPGVGLAIQHADCQAAIFYDPIQKALAVAHAGWRGSVANVYAKTVQFMQAAYNSKPQNLLVGISPSLGPEDAQFIHYKQELPESFWKFQTKPNYFDFWAISRMQLETCGIPSEQIEIAGISTFSHPEDYFSYRRDKVTGRHATVAMLR